MAKLISRTTLSGETRLSSCKGNLLNTDLCMGNLLYTDKSTKSLIRSTGCSATDYLSPSYRLTKNMVLDIRGFGFHRIKGMLFTQLFQPQGVNITKLCVTNNFNSKCSNCSNWNRHSCWDASLQSDLIENIICLVQGWRDIYEMFWETSEQHR